MIFLYFGYAVVSAITFFSSFNYSDFTYDLFYSYLLLLILELIPFSGFLLSRYFFGKNYSFSNFYLFISGVSLSVIENFVINFAFEDSSPFFSFSFVFVLTLIFGFILSWAAKKRPC